MALTEQFIRTVDSEELYIEEGSKRGSIACIQDKGVKECGWMPTAGKSDETDSPHVLQEMRPRDYNIIRLC